MVALVTVLFGAAAPLVAVVWGTDAAYWATPARAAEILVGALVAFAVRGQDRTSGSQVQDIYVVSR